MNELLKHIYDCNLSPDEKQILINLLLNNVTANNMVSRANEVNDLYLLGYGLHKERGRTPEKDGAYYIAGRNLHCSPDSAYRAYRMAFKLPELPM